GGYPNDAKRCTSDTGLSISPRKGCVSRSSQPVFRACLSGDYAHTALKVLAFAASRDPVASVPRAKACFRRLRDTNEPPLRPHPLLTRHRLADSIPPNANSECASSDPRRPRPSLTPGLT